MKKIVKFTLFLLIVVVLALIGSCGASNEISTDDIVDGSVTTAKLADDAVTGDKIADGAVSSEHLASGVLAVDAQDTTDEPGIDYVSFDNVNLTAASPSANRSCQLTVPADGFVMVIATGQITIMGDETFAQAGVSDAAGSNTKTVQVGLGSIDETEPYQDYSFGVSAVYSVSAGTETFYCNMSIDGDADTKYDQCTLSAMYFATQY